MRVSFDDEERVPVVEDHTKDSAAYVELLQKATVTVEDLDAVDVGDVDTSLPIDT